MRDIVIDGYALGTGVGLGSYAERLVAGLMGCGAGRGVRLRVIRPAWRGPAPEGGLALRSPRTGHPLVDQLLWQSRLGSHAAAREPEAILLCPGPFWAPRVPARVAVVYHDCINRRFPRYAGRRALRRWFIGRQERFLGRCGVVFTESESAREDLIALAGADAGSIRVVPAWLPPGFEPEAARRAASHVRERYSLPERYWLYVGGYDYRKNVELLVRAYAVACAKVDCPALVLAGRLPADLSKPVCDPLGAARAAGLAPGRIVTPGFIRDEDMPGLYGGAELFVYPSFYEGFGLPPLEAMGCGCPALAADNSSLREVVTDAAYRFETANPCALSVLLERAARQPMPLNPDFDRRRFDEQSCIERYMAELEASFPEGSVGDR